MPHERAVGATHHLKRRPAEAGVELRLVGIEPRRLRERRARLAFTRPTVARAPAYLSRRDAGTVVP